MRGLASRDFDKILWIFALATPMMRRKSIKNSYEFLRTQSVVRKFFGWTDP